MRVSQLLSISLFNQMGILQVNHFCMVTWSTIVQAVFDAYIKEDLLKARMHHFFHCFIVIVEIVKEIETIQKMNQCLKLSF